MLMAMSMKVSGFVIRLTVKVYTCIGMEPDTRVNGLRTSNMGMGWKIGSTYIFNEIIKGLIL